MRCGMSRLHLKVKGLDRSGCTASTDSKSKKSRWEWSKLKSKVHCGLGYMRIGGLFVALEAYLSQNDISIMSRSLSKLPLKISKKLTLDWIGKFQLCLNFNLRPGHTQQRKLQLSQEYTSRVSASDSLGCRSKVRPNFNEMPAKAETLPPISEPVSHILTQELNIAWSVWIAKWDWRIYCGRSVKNISPVFSSEPELQR